MPVKLPPVAILCGGLGTRLAPLTDKTPKSLVKVAGWPFLYHQFDLLLKGGIINVVLCVGHLGDEIVKSVSDSRPHGLNVQFSFDGPTPLGTASALRKALPFLGDEFFVLYGDSYLPGVDYQAVYEAFKASGKPALMTVKRNHILRHQNNASYQDGLIRYYDKYQQTPIMHHIDYGLSIFTPKAISLIADPDLAHICRRLASAGFLAGYEVSTPMLGIGNHESLAEMEAFMEAQKQR